MTAPHQDASQAAGATGGADAAGASAAAGAAEAASLEAELVAAERMIFFADAVVAIAITLLVFGLPLPRGTSNSQLLHSLWDYRSEYLAFLISFVVIGNHWAVHRRLFRYVVRLGGHVSGLNMTWLLMMVITPFATRVLSGDGGFAVRLTFYALVQVTAAVCLLLMAREIARHGMAHRPSASGVSLASPGSADCRRRGRRCGGGAMTAIEISIPGNWPSGQALAMRALLQKSLSTGYPVIATVRPDATPDQIEDIYSRLGAMLRESGLAA